MFTVSAGSAEPIYRQLMQQVRRLIAAGVLAPDDALPSVRELAQALVVNPMTISKAYALLEAEGVLSRRRGIGMVIAGKRGGSSANARLALLRPTLERAAAEATQLALDDKAVLAFFKGILRGQR
jgi:GntR family transcriptional regulator